MIIIIIITLIIYILIFTANISYLMNIILILFDRQQDEKYLNIIVNFKIKRTMTYFYKMRNINIFIKNIVNKIKCSIKYFN